jgi:hypothetical protein
MSIGYPELVGWKEIQQAVEDILRTNVSKCYQCIIPVIQSTGYDTTTKSCFDLMDIYRAVYISCVSDQRSGIVQPKNLKSLMKC